MRGLSEMLRDEMDRANLQINTLAEKSGVSRATISAILHDRRPVVRSNTMERLAVGLGRPPDFFYQQRPGGASSLGPAQELEISHQFGGQLTPDLLESLLDTLMRGRNNYCVAMSEDEQGKAWLTIARGGQLVHHGLAPARGRSGGVPGLEDLLGPPPK